MLRCGAGYDEGAPFASEDAQSTVWSPKGDETKQGSGGQPVSSQFLEGMHEGLDGLPSCEPLCQVRYADAHQSGRMGTRRGKAELCLPRREAPRTTEIWPFVSLSKLPKGHPDMPRCQEEPLTGFGSVFVVNYE